ncbi:hypothetical protein N9891_00105 [bacterium]|nr:hypothetical protein [bacterium]
MELLLNLLNSGLLAQVEIETVTEEGISNLMKFAILISISGMIYSGFKLLTGDLISAIYALLGGIIIGAAPIIARALVVQ